MKRVLISFSLKKIMLIFVLLVSLSIFLFEKFQFVSQLPENDQCIASFDTFAFTFPSHDGATQELILPLPPWEEVSKVSEISDRKPGDRFEVIATRHANGNHEIWFTNFRIDVGQDIILLLYLTGQQKWLQIDPKIEGSSTIVERVFISDDQLVWGVGLRAGRFVISLFEDGTGNFVEQQVIEIPAAWNLFADSFNHNLSDFSGALWTPDGKFWIFSAGDAIYSIDPFTEQISMHNSLEEYTSISSVQLNPMGGFIINGFGRTGYFSFSKDKLTEIDLPENEYYQGISFVDNSGNFWLTDGYGWRKPDGNWHRLHPDPLIWRWQTVALNNWRFYSPPDPFMETSDGRIWFRIYRSNQWKTLRSGIAWFEPVTKEGCWFTSEGAQIIEDDQHRLWMVVENTLYSYTLNP
ncbi:hypothetical protein [Candidatus Leptofilum sp.]|uniref:hypothetical protein n=1 Tax=Candidatus Leptofilum sp. TaxID=3241576 RepID=UPI003B5A013D